MAEQTPDRPVRVGVFNTVAEAERAVHDLQAAGFTHDELAVICTDRHKTELFKGVQTPPPGGATAPVGIVSGGAIGAAIGGLTMAATAVATGGVSLLVAGGMALAGGALVGSFAGAMATRGLEPEMVNYYDQAVRQGKILVAVEVHGSREDARLAQAERILRSDGTTPVKLEEG